MKNLLFLLSFLFYSVMSTVKKENPLSKKSVAKEKIDAWFNIYSCNELEIKELRLIVKELELIIKNFDSNLDHLETLLAEYCIEVAQKHMHKECFLAVVKACEEAILIKYNKPSTFQDVLLQYSEKIHTALNQRMLK